MRDRARSWSADVCSYLAAGQKMEAGQREVGRATRWRVRVVRMASCMRCCAAMPREAGGDGELGQRNGTGGIDTRRSQLTLHGLELLPHPCSM